MKKIWFKNKKGYTLLEMLIVLMLIAIIIPTVFSIIYILLQQQVRIYRLSETKRQGDRIMSYMKERITREARTIVNQPQCQTPGVTQTQTGNTNVFQFGRDTGTQFSFSPNAAGAVIAIDPSVMVNTALNDQNVRVTNFIIQCRRRSLLVNPLNPGEGVTLVGISFTVEFNDAVASPDDLNSRLQYQTRIRLR